ncbi:acyltransferase family protein [uncultured Treponema sp.]|uniref:acyltransferase family protein n=1 Tax=uncultured Treponema sp. TaxID=162155 RepID=UPI002589A728|nr:acyltransferase family protein [uncultured Treponema sp.]
MKFAENKRNSNFELLRIFMMFFIILNHLFVHGFSKYAGLSDLEWFFVNSFKWLGMIGNYAFMLLTGYFSVSVDKINLSSIFKLHKKYFFYSVLIGTLFFIFKFPTVANNNFELENLYKENGFTLISNPLTGIEYIRSFFPVIFGINWYASSFLIFMLFIPFLNKCLKNCTKKEHLLLMGITIFIGSILQLVPKQQAFFPNAIFQFFMLYFIGAYIKLYGSYFCKFKKTNIIFAFLGICSIIFIQLLFLLAYRKNFISYNLLLKFSEKISTSFLTIAIAFFCFLFFEQLKKRTNKLINLIGKSTFGIYLIHDNCYFSIFLMNKILKINNGGGISIFKLLMDAALIFCTCSLIDIFVSVLLEKLILKRK